MKMISLNLYHSTRLSITTPSAISMIGTTCTKLVQLKEGFDQVSLFIQVQNCRAFALPDLDQSNSFVRDTLKDWVHTIVSEFGFDAIRCDTVPEVPKDFWHEYAESAGVYSIGEAFSADVGFVASFQGSVDALLNYPLYFALKNVFMVHQRDMREISIAFKLNRNEFSDTTILGNFADNHDNERFLHFNSDWNALKNALTLVMFAEVCLWLTMNGAHQ